MSLSIGILASIKVCAGLIASTISNSGLLYALSYKDQDALVFVLLKQVGEYRDIQIHARLAYVYDQRPRLRIGLCVWVDRYRKAG